MKYLIYCRKSTDTEDKQVLSLDSQERELLEIAGKHNLNIVKVFRESMSAKSEGRPVFDQIIKMVQSGKAEAILCWKLDRLARNFVDGGMVIDLLQRAVIKEIRTYEGTHLPSDNVLLLSLQFGVANQYIRDLSTNVKRGNREKLARGEWPNHAPFGYINDKATKTIVVDPIRSKYVVRVFDLYVTGTRSLKDISEILFQEGLKTRSGGKVLRSHIQKILGTVFYTSLMEREGKYYHGNHQALVSKDTFDKAQDVMHNRIHTKSKKLFFPLRGFLKCENCGCALTASLKKGHHYYYCTNGKQKCDEHKNYLRENYLYEVISNIFEDLHFSCCGTWTRTKILCSRGICPTIRRSRTASTVALAKVECAHKRKWVVQLKYLEIGFYSSFKQIILR
jgi:site-specific DNA recombinase